MKSITQLILDQEAQIRPAIVDDIVTSLVYTLEANGLLEEAFSDIHDFVSINVPDSNVALVQAVASLPEIAFLHTNQKAIELLLEILPYTKIDAVSKIESSLDARSARSIAKQINHYALGYRIIYDNGFIYVIVYEDATEFIELLKEYKLMKPSIAKQAGIQI